MVRALRRWTVQRLELKQAGRGAHTTESSLANQVFLDFESSRCFSWEIFNLRRHAGMLDRGSGR